MARGCAELRETGTIIEHVPAALDVRLLVEPAALHDANLPAAEGGIVSENCENCASMAAALRETLGALCALFYVEGFDLDEPGRRKIVHEAIGIGNDALHVYRARCGAGAARVPGGHECPLAKAVRDERAADAARYGNFAETKGAGRSAEYRYEQAREETDDALNLCPLGEAAPKSEKKPRRTSRSSLRCPVCEGRGMAPIEGKGLQPCLACGGVGLLPSAPCAGCRLELEACPYPNCKARPEFMPGKFKGGTIEMKAEPAEARAFLQGAAAAAERPQFPCPACKGTGEDAGNPDDPMAPCGRCEGLGHLFPFVVPPWSKSVEPDREPVPTLMVDPRPPVCWNCGKAQASDCGYLRRNPDSGDYDCVGPVLPGTLCERCPLLLCPRCAKEKARPR